MPMSTITSTARSPHSHLAGWSCRRAGHLHPAEREDVERGCVLQRDLWTRRTLAEIEERT